MEWSQGALPPPVVVGGIVGNVTSLLEKISYIFYLRSMMKQLGIILLYNININNKMYFSGTQPVSYLLPVWFNWDFSQGIWKLLPQEIRAAESAIFQVSSFNLSPKSFIYRFTFWLGPLRRDPFSVYEYMSDKLLTLQFEMGSSLQSLVPNPSAARQIFTCSPCEVKMLCRTTSSPCERGANSKMTTHLMFF